MFGKKKKNKNNNEPPKKDTTTVENIENPENNKTVISSMVYTEEERIKIANTEDLHKILSKILKRDTSVYRVR